MKEFCGEITYKRVYDMNGQKTNEWVHSDICKHSSTPYISPEYRDFLHKCLNEWLDSSDGTGAFWVGDSDYFVEWER